MLNENKGLGETMINDWSKWMDQVPFSKELGIEILEIKEGYAKGKIAAEHFHENQYGGIHGGCMYSLADTITGVAAISYGRMVTTVDGNFHYLSPAPGKQNIYCEAKVQRQGKTLGVYDCKIYGEDEKVYATGVFTFFALDKEIK